MNDDRDCQYKQKLRETEREREIERKRERESEWLSSNQIAMLS